jgi:hypothetical protein
LYLLLDLWLKFVLVWIILMLIFKMFVLHNMICKTLIWSNQILIFKNLWCTICCNTKLIFIVSLFYFKQILWFNVVWSKNIVH